MASRSGDALFGLINDILEMSRLEAGQLTLRPSLFAVGSLLSSAVEMFRAQAAGRGVTFRVDVADNVPAELFLDPGRLRQVLLNLLSNAVKFARPGEVLVLARVAGSEAGERLRLAVRDRGPAIPVEDRGQLFLPFSRLERPDGGDPIGTGLGLAICRHLIGMMGGSVGCKTCIYDDGASGNEFWIDLPLTLAPSQPEFLSLSASAPPPTRPLCRTPGRARRAPASCWSRTSPPTTSSRQPCSGARATWLMLQQPERRRSGRSRQGSTISC